MKVLIGLAVGLALMGCTDAERSAWGAYGEENDITCYSGGQAVFKDTSTGKVLAAKGGGAVFRSKTTGRYVRAYMDCTVVDKGTSQ